MIMSITQETEPTTATRIAREPAITTALAGVEDKGEAPISKVDEANIPVNIVLSEPDQFSGKWILLADNFKPCNSQVEIEIYELAADSKEALMEVVRALIVPLYQNAIEQLERNGHLFFWSGK